MYRVVLIDDEAIIVEGLRRVVDWKKFGCEVVGDACDAQTGRACIRRWKPDIVFTDIKMPGEDGLTMLAGLKGEFPRMQVTVLTGHRDFDYAQQAIWLGVSRYLLKPSRMEELEEAIRHMTGELDRVGTAGGESAEPEESETGGSAADRFLVRQAQVFIEENCARRLTLQEVADHCFISQWYLSKLLNRHLKKGFYDLLNEVRVEKAKKLMEDPALRVSEIAEVVGYVDTAHFSRVFKKTTGMSARDWRNAHCGQK